MSISCEIMQIRRTTEVIATCQVRLGEMEILVTTRMPAICSCDRLAKSYRISVVREMYVWDISLIHDVPLSMKPEVAFRPRKNFFFNTGPFALIATVISRSFLRGQAGRPRFSRPKHRLRRQIGIRWGEEIDSWERRRVYLFVFLNVRASVHGELTAYLPAYLRIFLSRARSCPRVGACAATVIARMPYDTGEIGSFGTNRPYEPLSRCISKAVSNCARSLACSLARVRADTARFKHQMLDITLH